MVMSWTRRFLILALFCALPLLAWPSPVDAYIGPGAGIAIVSSFLIVLITFLLALLTLLTWPFRWLLQRLKRRTSWGRGQTERVVILGLDGLDPVLTERFMAEGLLPHFERLARGGSYGRLGTTLPAESPVAWSSFQTGCNPGRHRVFDFLIPDRKTYLPKLCSAEIRSASRTLSLGPYRIPLCKPRILFERKSRSFWKTLGDHGIPSTVLRVPVSFPPEKFEGRMLSAMSVPDLRGTLGTFSYYTSDPVQPQPLSGGVRIPVRVENGRVRSHIEGPAHPWKQEAGPLRIAFEVHLTGERGDAAEVKLNGSRHPLPLGRFTPWIRLQFRGPLGKSVRGIGRFYLRQVSPYFQLYLSPLNIDPESPILPISHPLSYSMYLAKTQGPFATLGLAEDTWALNEGVLDEEAFLKQAYLVRREREGMFFDAIEKTARGAVICVFDITDRIQHMFWRYLEEDHPANADKDSTRHPGAIRELCQRMDDLLARTLAAIHEDTVLILLSDHGFKSFRRGVNLNSWLYRQGYLVLRDEPTGADGFQGVDWVRTQAYAVGMGGIYLNLRGREARGAVSVSRAESLKSQITQQLKEMEDPQTQLKPVAEIYDTALQYRGPYASEGPDLVVGFRAGYRASWSTATGAVTWDVIEDNVKNWSGDHCMNPPEVPGVLFCNRAIRTAGASIMDIGPTVLDLFGIPTPSYCDGRSLLPESGSMGEAGGKADGE